MQKIKNGLPASMSLKVSMLSGSAKGADAEDDDDDSLISSDDGILIAENIFLKPELIFIDRYKQNWKKLTVNHDCLFTIFQVLLRQST